MINIRQLADLAGVSRMTVSRALRNAPGVSKQTREAILRLAVKHGYKPDPVMSGLMTQMRVRRDKRSVEKLAYLTWWDTEDGWKKSRNDLCWFRGASQRAAQSGYELEHYWARQPGLTQTRLSRILYTRHIRGVIVAPIPKVPRELSLEWEHFAVVTIIGNTVTPRLHQTTPNHSGGVRLALKHLTELEYHRIGMVAPFTGMGPQVAWLPSYLFHYYHLSKNEQIPPLEKNQLDATTLERWINRYKIDAVISNLPETYHLLRTLGYKMPEDVGFASLDCQHPTDPWAGVDQLPELVGAAAVDLLANQLNLNELGVPEHPQTISIDSIWCDGPSIRSLHNK